MSRTIHCCINIQGILREKGGFLKSFTHSETGFPLSAAEAKKYLNQCLSEGKKVLPFGQPCEGFDYVNGCPGHEEKTA